MRQERTTRRSRTDTPRSAPARADAERVRADELATTRGRGAPLDRATRSFMETRFGHDFANVRVHDDAGADASARALRAHAYTVGSDVAFRAGRYEPDTIEGLALLGHELAHVVQQEGAALPADGLLSVSRPSDAAESTARAAGLQAVTGAATPGAVAAGSTPTASVQREEEESSFWGDMLGIGLGAAAMVPGLGLVAEPLAATFGLAEGVEAGAHGDPVKSALGFTHGASGIMGLAAELGGFEVSEALGLDALAALTGAETAGASVGALGALGSAGLVLGAGALGGGIGYGLQKYTSVGDHAQETIGGFDAMMTGDGERSWVQRTAEAAGDDWDEGDYVGAIGNGLELGGVGLVGALGGIGGGIVDGVGAIGSGIAGLFDDD